MTKSKIKKLKGLYCTLKEKKLINTVNISG